MNSTRPVILLLLLVTFFGKVGQVTHGAVTHDTTQKTVRMADASGNLALRLNYDGKCLLDQVVVRGHQVVAPDTGVCSAIRVAGQWHTTRANIPSPRVTVARNSVVVRGIRFGGGGVQLTETWRFKVCADRIVWRIERTYLSGGTLNDTSCPGFDFSDMQTWTGALLGHGGVAWGKLFDSPNASYGVHTGAVTFWNKDKRACLRIIPQAQDRKKVAVRFSRQPSGIFSFNYSVTDQELATKHGNSRFLHQQQDVWAPFKISPGKVIVEYTLSAHDYDAAFDRGTFPHLGGTALREICHTIARIGAVDEHLHGSNGYYSDCAVLHEPWIAQLGLAIDDPAYFRAYADTLEYEREHAIAPDGRVKPRWAGTAGDAIPGSYDSLGFYEAQWGYLMDAQPSWVINVAELFDFTGDRVWLQRQKATGERVLDYLLRRDSDGDGLVEMLTDSHQQAKGSDWIDVVWASYENALVNAQMFWAMTLWADLEDLLGDAVRAARYRHAAQKLKTRFNQSAAEGGFWDTQNQCYAYWRDKDDSIHGTNLVVPVNFSAIGYGLCDDPARRAAILNRIEALMQQEQLFCWPLCFFSYADGEAHSTQYPFPTYENGDIFLAWGELGTRAYASHNPAVPLKYVQKVLGQYAKDGLAFQRYLRKSQTGAGRDILANNCSIIVGLYRNIYGLQPKHNRLYLEPHLTPELNGTQLKYWLRGQQYVIGLHATGCRIAADGFALHDPKPFAVNVTRNAAEYFSGDRKRPSLSLSRSAGQPLEVRIESWSNSGTGLRKWTEFGLAASAQHIVWDLQPNTGYTLYINGTPVKTLRSDVSGRATFKSKADGKAPVTFEVKP
ncbi:MAG: hypothetical protein AAB466_04610 [Verrucomicrobiota bacterium]